MKIYRTKHNCLMAIIALSGLLMASCGSSKSYKAKYETAWQEVVESEAWQSSLNPDPSVDLYAQGNETDEQWLTGNDRGSVANRGFESKYNSWVNRAYFKIISEAEAADKNIKAEYERFIAENPDATTSTDDQVVKIVELYQRKYKSHKSMLEGLKSWQAFETYGSDDLKFFKEENREVVWAMYNDRQKEENIIDFLVYKLADLYHSDE